MQTAGLVVLYVVAATLAHVTEAQFPRVCTTVDHLRSKECCPVPGGYTQPCGGPGRGSCQVIPDGTMKVYDHKPNWVRDDRSQWPKLFFNRSCTCEFPFSGYDCSKCVWGRYGSACDVTKTIVRKNVKGLSSEDRVKYQTYLNRAKTDTSDYVVATEFYDTMVNSSTSVINPSFVDVSVYDFLVWMHYYASRETILPPDNDICKVGEDCEFDTAHDAVGFLTWHRGFLLEMERLIQEVNSDPDWAIPYWDWTASEQCDICTNDFVGANDDSGNLDSGSAFSGWEALCEDAEEQHGILKPCDPNHRRNPPLKLKRNPGGQDKYGETLRRLPRREEVDFALRFATFDNSPFNKTSDCVFRNLVEGYADTTTGKYRPDIIGPDGEIVVPGAHTLHNHVHIYLNGTMGAVPTSSNDPIFWLHHASIDRIFEKWLRKYKPAVSEYPLDDAPPGHNRDEYIVPLFPPYTHGSVFKPSTDLGYDFEGVDADGKSDGDEEPGNTDLGECGSMPGAVSDVASIAPPVRTRPATSGAVSDVASIAPQVPVRTRPAISGATGQKLTLFGSLAYCIGLIAFLAFV